MQLHTDGQRRRYRHEQEKAILLIIKFLNFFGFFRIDTCSYTQTDKEDDTDMNKKRLYY